MSKRLLAALDYPEWDSVDVNDEATFRNIVAWIEIYKINKASPNVQEALKNINSDDWSNSYEIYKEGLGCLPNLKTPQEQLRWLLGYAVQTDFHKNKDMSVIGQGMENLSLTDVLYLQGDDFAEGVKYLAKLLNITTHPDPLITLKAVAKVIEAKFSSEALINANEFITKVMPIPLEHVESGFDLNDPDLNEAAKILRLLYIQDLRKLQTRANELIAAAQSITAKPKID